MNAESFQSDGCQGNPGCRKPRPCLHASIFFKVVVFDSCVWRTAGCGGLLQRWRRRAFSLNCVWRKTGGRGRDNTDRVLVLGWQNATFADLLIRSLLNSGFKSDAPPQIIHTHRLRSFSKPSHGLRISPDTDYSVAGVVSQLFIDVLILPDWYVLKSTSTRDHFLSVKYETTHFKQPCLKTTIGWMLSHKKMAIKSCSNTSVWGVCSFVSRRNIWKNNPLLHCTWPLLFPYFRDGSSLTRGMQRLCVLCLELQLFMHSKYQTRTGTR